MPSVAFAGLRVMLPAGWADVTESLNEPDRPPTLAKIEGGVGALQVSIATHAVGDGTDFDRNTLEELLRDFASTQGWEVTQVHSEDRPIAWADFAPDGEAIRVWYVSNGSDLAFWTYVSLTAGDPQGEQERAEADRIVRSTRFARDP